MTQWTWHSLNWDSMDYVHEQEQDTEDECGIVREQMLDQGPETLLRGRRIDFKYLNLHPIPVPIAPEILDEYKEWIN